MVDSSGSIMDDYYWKLETEGPLVAEQYRNWPHVQDFLVQLADVFTINDQHTRVSSINIEYNVFTKSDRKRESEHFL